MTHQKIKDLSEQLNQTLLSKPEIIHKVICCFFAKGHILLEDSPGVGKTTLSKAFAALTNLPLSRIQFTNDTLPSDLIGYSLYDAKNEKTKIIKGPLFNHFILIDELNRGNPKTQSALLQAMEEREISIDGITFSLPRPFFVFANQNPRESIGTNPLPESQLDRFMISLSIGYPDQKEEAQVIRSAKQKNTEHLKAIFDNDEITQIQNDIEDLPVSDSIADYVVRILNYTRQSPQMKSLSPRAGQDLIAMAKANCYLNQREQVLPEDIQFALSPCLIHRVCEPSTNQGINFINEILENVNLYT